MYSVTGGHLLWFKAVLYIKGSCYLLAYFSRDLQTFFNAISNSSWNYRGCTCTLSMSHNSLCSAVDQRPLTITVTGGSQYTTHMLVRFSGYHSRTQCSPDALVVAIFLYTCHEVITINTVEILGTRS